ncbi:MAG: ferredoxin [Actinobacteria bacterium]|jgi:ferredoxin|nr:ferredoxin [Actinomycetota bacterium]
MAINIKINKDCQAWGQCVFDAPEVFDLVESERKTWKYSVEDSLLEKVKTAQLHCPNRAISFEVIDNE